LILRKNKRFYKKFKSRKETKRLHYCRTFRHISFCRL